MARRTFEAHLDLEAPLRCSPALAFLLLTSLLVGASPLPAQDDSTAVSREPLSATPLLGAVSGSAVGLMLWWQGGGRYDDYGSAIVMGWMTTAVGSAIGARAFSEPDRRPHFGRLLVGASVGMIAGTLLAMAAAQASRDLDRGTLAISYSVGQGALTTLIGLPPRRRGRD